MPPRPLVYTTSGRHVSRTGLVFVDIIMLQLLLENTQSCDDVDVVVLLEVCDKEDSATSAVSSKQCMGVPPPPGIEFICGIMVTPQLCSDVMTVS